MITDTELKMKGFQILNTHLGTVETARFISLVNREKFDYTKWRQNLFNGMSIQEISDAAEKFPPKLAYYYKKPTL